MNSMNKVQLSIYNLLISYNSIEIFQSLWFPLLDTLMLPQRRLKEIENKDILSGKNLI